MRRRFPFRSPAALATSTARRIGLALAAPATLAAHVDNSVSPANWVTAWSFEPAVVASLFLAAALYVSGLRCLRAATGAPSKLGREAFLFWCGWALLVVALVSPVHPLGAALFSVHMVQHELLMVAAAPLLVLGRPGLVWLWAFPRGWIERVAPAVRRALHSPGSRWLRHPATAWLVHAVALWAWHIPSWFEATRTHVAVHALQHVCFLGSAWWFWDAVFFGPSRRAGYGMGVVYLFTTALHTGALGALITFAGRPWYPAYETTTAAWGLSAVEDQQLGGLIMWVPAGLTYIIAALALFAGWMNESDRRAGTIPGQRAASGVAGSAWRQA